MNCDFSDFKQETINCNGVNLENLFSLVSDVLLGYQAIYCTLLC